MKDCQTIPLDHIQVPRSARHPAVLAVCLAIFFTTGHGKTLNLNCSWRGADVNIDSINEDWGSAVFYSEQEKISLTVLNDSDFLYLRLNTRDRDRLKQITGLGCTIWLDPEGGKDRSYGIHFPLGRRIGGMPMMEPVMDRKSSQASESLFAQSFSSSDELEIIGPRKDDVWPLSLINAEKRGLKVKIGISNGNLFYVLRIPLARDTVDVFSIGIGHDPSALTTAHEIGIGLETPEMKMGEKPKGMGPEGDMPDMGGGMPGGGMSGGGPPGGGPPGGGPPGGGPSGSGERSKPLKLWIVVQLATPPSTSK